MSNTLHYHRELVLAAPMDLALTLGVLQRGTGDPAVQVLGSGSRGTAWLTFRWQNVPVTLRVSAISHGVGQASLRAEIWVTPPITDETAADMGKQILAGIEAFLGVDERALAGWSDFDRLLAELPDSAPVGRLRQARHKHPGLRLPATGALSTGAVVEQLFRVVLEQKVTHDQARASWRWLVRSSGEPAPLSEIEIPGVGRRKLMVTPTAEQVLAIPSWAWHRDGWVQPTLATTMRTVAARAESIDRLEDGLSSESAAGTEKLVELAEKLTTLPGIGPWTVAETLQRTHGTAAADLISVGDFHLAHHVGEFFTGRRTDDAGMVEILEPFRPHRHRVVRLMYLAMADRGQNRGQGFSRFGPRLAPADYRKF